MSETTSAATGRCFGIQRVCQVWERSRSALYARRARAHHRRGGGPPPAIGRAAAGGDSDRSRSVPVPRRRPSQGPRTASDPGWDPSRPHAGAARHAGARTALPAPRASGRREDPRREGHHSGAQRDVGDGRRAGIHARRRVGLDLRGRRTLERGVRGVARVQSREPLRGTRSDCARARTALWLAGRRRRGPRGPGGAGLPPCARRGRPHWPPSRPGPPYGRPSARTAGHRSRSDRLRACRPRPVTLTAPRARTAPPRYDQQLDEGQARRGGGDSTPAAGRTVRDFFMAAPLL